VSAPTLFRWTGEQSLKPIKVHGSWRLFGEHGGAVRAKFVPPPGAMRAPVPGELPIYDSVAWLLGDPITGRRPTADQALDGILVAAGVPR
jgi:hypothetical protein